MTTRFPSFLQSISRLLCVLALLSVSACATAGAVGTHAPAPGPGPYVSPGYITATWNPTDPELQYINNPAQVSLGPHGDFLVADIGTFDRKYSKIVEITPTGHVVWALYGPGLDFAHSAYLMDNGDILVADTNHNRVLEVNRAGQILWNSDELGGGNGYYGHGRFSDGSQLLYPNDAKQLPNGHLLISSRMNSTVYEINTDGHVYWKCHSFINLHGKPDHLFRQHNPHRLPNGDTLIADSDNGRIVEVNPSCTREVWEFGGSDPILGTPYILWPRDANLIDNFNNNDLNSRHYGAKRFNLPGYVLVDDSKHDRLLLVTHDRHPQIIRQWKHLNQPYAEQLLPNDTFAVGASDLHGVDIFSLSGNLTQVISTRPPMTLSAQVMNPGFEPMADQVWARNDLLTETLPPGVRADMSFDTTVKHSGQSSAMIHWSSGSHLSLSWGQAVSLKQDHRYRFTGWIKTKDVGPCPDCNYGIGTPIGSTAYYDLIYIEPGPYRPPPDVTPGYQSGTQGWTKWTATFDVPDNIVGIAINATLDGKGTVWFDDVSLTDLGAYKR